jgi:hypothetical protein
VIGAHGGITLGPELGVDFCYLGVKDLPEGSYYDLSRMAREPSRSDKDGVRAGVGAIHPQDAGRGAADLA